MDELSIEHQAPISTWFRVGGRADRLVRPASVDQLRACLELDPSLLVLGEGANLLVDDEGVGALVVELSGEAFHERDEPEAIEGGNVRLRVGAAARLPKLINECVSAGLGGLECLAGFPASIGGAVRMNAGGAFGEIADVIESVTVLDRQGRVLELERSQLGLDYRTSNLDGAIVLSASLRLRPESPASLDQRRREVMQYKAKSQPLSAKSAGCCFKNPTLTSDVDGLGAAGQRVSAGLVIDRAGGKELSIGGASVSDRHANFITTTPEAKASDAIALIDSVRELVLDKFGIELQREVVVWGRAGEIA